MSAAHLLNRSDIDAARRDDRHIMHATKKPEVTPGFFASSLLQ
jgi:hypothetical protein